MKERRCPRRASELAHGASCWAEATQHENYPVVQSFHKRHSLVEWRQKKKRDIAARTASALASQLPGPGCSRAENQTADLKLVRWGPDQTK